MQCRRRHSPSPSFALSFALSALAPRALALCGVFVAAGAGCQGKIGSAKDGTTPPSDGTGGTFVEPPPPFEAINDPGTVARKVKNLLTGLGPTDAEIATIATDGAAGLKTLIATWTTDAQFQDQFRSKMIFFFRNTFQQSGFTPLVDFNMQLQTNGGFDINGGTRNIGDDSFARLVQNLQDSFAMTAWQLVADGRPFTDVLTTQRFMMTTALKSLYLQIEMPNDQPFARLPTGQTKIPWKIDYSGAAIPLAETLDPSSPNYMIFDDETPLAAPNAGTNAACRAVGATISTTDPTTMVVTTSQLMQVPMTGYAQLFQRLLGNTPQYPQTGTTLCSAHSSKPYFTTQDVSDWQWVTVRPLASGETRLQPFDLPKVRAATELALALPRVGFYTTPAYLALWNTNDSNQHRVTANQALLVALGQSYSSENQLAPLSTAGLDGAHAVAGTECYGCHQGLDPLRNFWATQFDFNDRNDFPARGVNGGAANPRPAATGGAFAFGSVNATGSTVLDFGALVAQVIDSGVPSQAVDRFALAMTQKLCFFANSSACVERDPEFRRIALAFQNSNYGFATLISEMMSSPLVTGSSGTLTFDELGQTISVARRDQLCASLSNRLGKPDLCALAVPLPATAQAATLRIATSVAADAFSRGAESPVTPSDPTLFYRAATEMLCENIAVQVVDAATGTVFASTGVPAAIEDMVVRVMGYPPSDVNHAAAVQILQQHYDTAAATKDTNNRNYTATNALRSTFVLACESPTALSFGL
jgi:hypothetical protein